MNKNKLVTYKNLKKGQKIEGHRLENVSRSYKAIVKAVNPSYVTVMLWGEREERIDSRSLFEVKMTEQEFQDEYRNKAKDVVKNIQNKLHRDEIGYHEMWNVWLFGSPYEIAQYCIDEKFEIVGYCSDIVSKTPMFSDDVMDVGVCGEYKDGERFWCHYRYSDIQEMLKLYEDLNKDYENHI